MIYQQWQGPVFWIQKCYWDASNRRLGDLRVECTPAWEWIGSKQPGSIFSTSLWRCLYRSSTTCEPQLDNTCLFVCIFVLCGHFESSDFPQRTRLEALGSWFCKAFLTNLQVVAGRFSTENDQTPIADLLSAWLTVVINAPGNFRDCVSPLWRYIYIYIY